MEKAVLYAVGNTLVCDKLDEAKTLSWSGERYKGKCMRSCSEMKFSKKNYAFLALTCMYLVVTVDGILLTKSGTMTGGVSGGMEARSNKWDDSRIECTYPFFSIITNRYVQYLVICLTGSSCNM